MAQLVRGREILSALPLVRLGEPQLFKGWKSTQRVYGLQFSPDGAFLAVAAEGGNVQGGAELWRTRDWKSWATFPGRTRIAWAPNSRLFAIENRGVDVYDVPQKRLNFSLQDGSGINSAGSDGSAGVYGPLLFSADSSKLATLGEDPQSQWELDDGPNTEAAYVRELAVKVWDVSSGKRLLAKPGPWSNGYNYLIRLSDDPDQLEFARTTGLQFAVSTIQPQIYVFSDRSYPRKLFGTRVHPSKPYATISVNSPYSSVAIAGNGWIYGALDSQQQAVQLFRSRDQKPLRLLSNFRPITAIALSPDASTLAVAHDQLLSPKSFQGYTLSQISIYRLFPTKN